MTAYSPKEYWTGVAEDFRSADATGFAPVLHPDAPAWFNRMIDGLQFRAVQRALAIAAVPHGARILDVGCGTGRWLRRYGAIGYQPTGLDATPAMLQIARQQGTVAPLIAGEAHRLPFTNATFDCVSDITVVQHIQPTLQSEALGEMLRVLKPGGKLILMELIRGKGAHIFPRSPQDWIQQAISRGAKQVAWFGQEFLLLDRAFTHVAQSIAGRNGSRTRDGALPDASVPHPITAARGAYWALRRITAPLSAWTDPIAERICPAAFATHGVFVFQK
jgi:ubiquinone/menaquinone biosynthesis C-methylase UbiE